MAGIDGGVGGLRPGSTGPLHGTNRAAESKAPQKPGTENLSISRTEGQQPGTRSAPMAGIPTPNPDVANLLANMSTADLDALLAGLNQETNETQQNMVTAEAEARRSEVQSAQTSRQEALEQLGTEKAEAQKEAQCVEVKQTFASMFSLGFSQLSPWHKEQSDIKAGAQQKIITIELQESGMIGIPAPQLDPLTQEISKDFFSSSSDKFDHVARDIVKNQIDEMFLDNTIDRDTQVSLRTQLESATSPDEFFRTAMLAAAQNAPAPNPGTPPPQAGAAEQPEAQQPMAQDTPMTPPGPAKGAATPNTIPDADDTKWLNEMAALMNNENENMNGIISQMKDAKINISNAAQDGNSIANMRFGNI